ncbi:MAG: hypothetical protein PHD15_07455 [Clostridia bacterium]|nr:hypothetical protein [Clostridia bacterium]
MNECIETFNSIKLTDKIQIISTIITTIGILVSFIISIITLKQNNKFKREESRANIVCYIEHISKSSNSYIVIKNFGNSVGKVINITMNKDIDLNKILGITSKDFKNILQRKNYLLAPNQKVSSWYNFIQHDIEDFTVTLEYETLGKIYKEDYLLSSKYVHSVVYTDKSKSGYNKEENILNNMNESLREISEKL